MSVEEYLERERTSDEKHEYIDGLVYAMAGGSLRHAAIAQNVGSMLRDALRGRACLVLSSDARVHVPETRLYTYPDVTVLCGQARTDPKDRHSLTNPTLVVEVLSEGTEAHDRGAKAAHYRRMKDLRAYLLVSTDAQRLELYERADDGRWILTEAEGDAALAIPSLEVELRIADVYAGLDLLGDIEPPAA